MNRGLLAVGVAVATLTSCGLEVERTSSTADTAPPPTARAAPTTTTRPGPRLTIEDEYWSQDRDTYYVVVGHIASHHNYCEVHLTLNNRRTGEWSNELLVAGESEATFEFYMPESLGARVDFDGYEIECS